MDQVILRPAQQSILKYTGGKMGISAVPGSGKTFIIEQLVIKLIKAGTPPDRIGIATYMRSSRGNLAARLQNQLSDGRGRVNIFTLHSLSLQILRELQPSSLQVRIQEEYEKIRLINKLVNQWMNLYEYVWKSWVENETNNLRKEIRDQLVSAVQMFIGKAKHKCLAPREILATKGTLLYYAVELYEKYQSSLQRQRKIDYDDMASQAIILLEHNTNARSIAQSWFDYLLEDEAQDTSELQEKLLNILSIRSGNLVRVGDPNQCISSTFTNASPELFRDFCNKFQNHEQILIESNRSARSIINLANYLVDWSCYEHPELKLRSALKHQHIFPATTGKANPDDSESQIEFIRVSGELQDELLEIAKCACEAVKQRPHHSFAILVNTNDHGSNVIDYIKQQGMEYNDLLRNNTSIKQLIEVIFHITKFLAEPTVIGNILVAFEAMTPFFGIPPSQLTTITNCLGKYYPEILLYPPLGQAINIPPIDRLDHEFHQKTIGILELLSDWLDQSSLPWDELLRIIIQYLQKSTDDLYIGNYLVSQLELALQDNLLAGWSDIVFEISQILERPLTNIPSEIRNYKPAPGVITVLTLHKSKGLEWDEVYIASCSAYNFPVSKEDRSEKRFNLQAGLLSEWNELINPSIAQSESEFFENAAERLRLLYVAITRSQRRLTLSVCTQWNDKDQPASFIFDRLEAFYLGQKN